MKNNIKTGIWYIVDDVDRSISKIDILHVDSKTITEYCGYGEWETSRITKFDYKVYIPTGNRWSQTIMNAYLSGKLCKTLDEAKEYAINKFLLELNNNYNINQDYYKELLLTLKAYGYKEISLPFMRCQVAGYESKSVYTKTYDTQLDILIEEGASPAEARKQAEAAAKRAQMDYILEHVKSLLEFRKACNDVGYTNAEVNQYRREVLNLER